MELKPEHLAILERNKQHLISAKDGWVSNVQDLDNLEHVYHTYIDSRYVLTKWCSPCVMKMLLNLSKLYDANTSTRTAQ